MTLENLEDLMIGHGVKKLYCKQLAPNDNSKNQPYFGGDLSSLNILPTGPVELATSVSKKPGVAGRKIFKAPLSLSWLTPGGEEAPAPAAQLILYPQYPEVRFSGYLKGATVDVGEWMDPGKSGRAPGRCLFLGVRQDGLILAYLGVPHSTLSKQLAERQAQLNRTGVFLELPIAGTRDTHKELLQTLRAIYRLGWVKSHRLDARGNALPCNSPNCGGYTLEALLGVRPNGYAEPDYLGWEIKQYGVRAFESVVSKAITLLTPEPDGGFYTTAGAEAFLRRFGYRDQKGRDDRINFGGIHRFGAVAPLTSLTLALPGFDAQTGAITDPAGGVALISDSGEITAQWSYHKLINHWKTKHNRAVYVPSMVRTEGERSYRYGNKILLCTGTDFYRFLNALVAGAVYYDPGIKMEGASSPVPVIKRRSQFRAKAAAIGALYESAVEYDLALEPNTLVGAGVGLKEE